MNTSISDQRREHDRARISREASKTVVGGAPASPRAAFFAGAADAFSTSMIAY
jgi:hypothetical protein